MCGLKEEQLSKMKVVVGYFVVLKTIWGITSLAYCMKQMENTEEANSVGLFSLNSETMKRTQKQWRI